MALERDLHSRDNFSSPISSLSSTSQIVSCLNTLAPNALNLFASGLYLRRNAVLGLAGEAVEHRQDSPKV